MHVVQLMASLLTFLYVVVLIYLVMAILLALRGISPQGASRRATL